jgi:hypothetical protein
MRAACLVSGCRPLHTAGMHQHTPGSAHGGQHVAHTLLRICGRPSHTPGADSASSPRPVPSGARGSGRWSCRHPHSQGTAGCNAEASAPGLHQGRHRRRRYSSVRSHTAPRCRKSVCLDLRLLWMRRDQLLCMPRWRPPWSTTLRVSDRASWVDGRVQGAGQQEMGQSPGSLSSCFVTLKQKGYRMAKPLDLSIEYCDS